MSKHKTPKRFLDEDKFVTQNFEWLVDRFGGKRVVICQGEVFTGRDAVDSARKRFPRATPLWMPVPTAKQLAQPFLL